MHLKGKRPINFPRPTTRSVSSKSKSTQEPVQPQTTTPTVTSSIVLPVTLPTTSSVTLSPIQTITISQPSSCATMSMGLGQQLRAFSGKESPITWIGQFDAWRILNNVDDNKSLQAIIISMQGPAGSWIHSVPETSRDSVQKFKQLFMERFDQIKQESSEEPSEYLSRIEELSLGANLPEEALVNMAVNGLNSKVKSYVIGQKPKVL